MNNLQNATSSLNISMYPDDTHLTSAASYPDDVNIELIPEVVKYVLGY